MPAAKKPQGWIYKPTDFEPSDYKGAIAKHPDAARWLLNVVYFKRVIRNYAADEFVNLHSQLLALVMGDVNHVKPIREALENHHLIECDHSWSKDTKSLGYRLGPALDGAQWAHYHSDNRRFTKRVEKFKQWVRQPQGFRLPVHEHLAHWAKQVQAPQCVDGLHFCGEDEDKRRTKASLAAHQVEMLREQMLHFNVCPYGRFHSNYTGLCREVRPALALDGAPLVEIDVVNSQPYFLALLLWEIAVAGRNLPRLSQSLQTAQQQAGGGSLPHVSGFEAIQTSGNEATRRQPEVPRDLRAFIEQTAEGTFYETLQPYCDCERDRLKPKVFQVLYGDRRVMTNSALTEAFRTLYPTAFDLTLRLKAHKGYEWVGRELQRRESRAIINGVCDELRRDYPQVPVVTIHDSLLTTRQHLPLVQGLLSNHFSQFPRQPKFRVKGQ